jgi:hypothetical protein
MTSNIDLPVNTPPVIVVITLAAMLNIGEFV